MLAKFEPLTVTVNGPLFKPTDDGARLVNTGRFPLPAARVMGLEKIALSGPPVLPTALNPMLAFRFCLVEVASETPSILIAAHAGGNTGLSMFALFIYMNPEVASA